MMKEVDSEYLNDWKRPSKSPNEANREDQKLVGLLGSIVASMAFAAPMPRSEKSSSSSNRIIRCILSIII